MRAVVHDRYGPPEVLYLADVERPRPRPDEVLVAIRCTTVNRTDTALRAGTPAVSRVVSGLRRPRWRILGSEFAGVVVEAGREVREFRVGERVFGVHPWKLGAHAEYLCIRERAPLARMPERVSYSEAAPVCDGALLAMMNLRKAGLRRGQRALIYGASGAIGTAAVQLARVIGAQVTGVTEGRHVDLVRSLGATDVLDYTRDDFTANGHAYDVIFDAVGKLTYARCEPALAPGGVYIPTDGWGNIGRALLPSRAGARHAEVVVPPRYTKDDVVLVRRLIEAGEYRAVVDRSYPIEQVVDANIYVDSGLKTGNVVLTVSED